VDDARVVVTPDVTDHHHRATRQVRRQIDRVVARAAAVLDLADEIERLLRDGAEQLAALALLDLERLPLAAIAVDRREVHEALAPVDADADRDGGVAVEVDALGDADEVVP